MTRREKEAKFKGGGRVGEGEGGGGEAGEGDEGEARRETKGAKRSI